MINWILTSCILIAAVIALRQIFKGRISMRMRYGLWALVLIRLLIPGNFIPSNLSIENLALSFSQQPQVQQITQEWNAPQQSYESVYQEVVQEHYQAYYPEMSTTPATPPDALTATLPAQEQMMIQQEAQKRVEQSAPIYSLTQILIGIWILGALIAGTVLLTINWDFSRRLKLTRRVVETDAAIPVYKSFMAETPCLFGLFRPVIYITEETAADPVALSHILAHESTHYRHRDHIWAFLRSICLVLHWYNPLVWLAVSLSKRDCELACDEATIAHIGEENRIPYGKTLISITCIKRAPSAMLLTATTMLSDKKTLTERIQQVARKPKVVISAVVAAVIIAAVAVGCTFTGAPNETTDPTDPTETTEATEPTETTESTTAPTETTASTNPSVDTAQVLTYKVGTDILAGTYAFIPNDPTQSSYFHFDDHTNSVTETFTGQFIWDLTSGSTVKLQNCHYVPIDAFSVTQNEDGSYGPGMFRVGIDIPEGNYVITPLNADTSTNWKLFFSISQMPYHNDYYSHSSTIPESISLTSPWGAILLENCTISPVVSETFTIPAAPEAAKVQSLPLYYSAESLTTPYWEQGVDIVGHGTYFISIPSVFPFSQDAVDCQADIYNDLLPTLKFYEETAGYTDIYDIRLLPMSEKENVRYLAGIDYAAYEYKDILSIVVWVKNYYDGIDYYVYNLDLDTGKRMSNEDVLSRMGIHSVDLKSLLEAEYISRWSDPAEPEKYYTQQREKTTSSENIAASQIYVTSDGTVMVAARIYSLAGADSNMHLLTLYAPPVLSGRAAIKYKHADWNYEPSSTAEDTARSIVSHFDGAGEIILVEYDKLMTQTNITLGFASSEVMQEYDLTEEYLQNHFKCIVVTYQANQNATHISKLWLLQDEESGLWYLWDSLTPYSTGSYDGANKQLAVYNALFDSTTSLGRMRQMALTSFYDRPSQVDISLMFSSDFTYGDLTESEKAFLTQKGFELKMSVQSHSQAVMNDILLTTFNITLAESNKIGLDSLTYFKDTDSYYSNNNSSCFPDITVTRYEDVGNGVVKLYYTCANQIHFGYENQEFIVTISQNRDGSIHILSNSLPGSNNDNDRPRFPDAPSNTTVKALPGNAQLSDLVKPYWELGAQFAPNGDTYYVFIPEIYPFSQEAIDCQAQIYELFAEALKAQLNYLSSNYFVTKYLYTADVSPEVGKTSGGTFYYGYTASYQDGLLSIVVTIDNVHTGQETYHTFNLAVPSGQVSTGAQPSREAIRAALEAEYKQMHAIIDSSLDFYQENLKKTLSDENIDACVLSYAGDGTPQITAWIYTFGSVDKVQKLIPVLPLSE